MACCAEYCAASLDEAGEEEEDDSLSQEQRLKEKEGTFEIVGTVSSAAQEQKLSFAAELYHESLVLMDEGENENDETGGSAQEFFDALKENMDQNGADEDEPEDTRSKIPPFNKNIIPEFVLSLNATDAFLKDRVLNLPESAVEGTHYTQDQFPLHLQSFRENNVEDETVLNYFDELEIHMEHIEITSSDDTDYLLVMEKITDVVGNARNYGRTSEELEEEEQKSANEKLKQLADKQAEMERKEAQEAASRAARWEEWVDLALTQKLTEALKPYGVFEEELELQRR
ncbi:hypothetical protein JZ751_003023 [Albula glossodonta]|uniref:Uncharacterized protein n=1 Tax=Albula glossodonta TaxID=121402 RepID=A0A8T2N8I8_9TELE|nr:hypothetical protein JZ751_003023 [Albula glossodonta]